MKRSGSDLRPVLASAFLGVTVSLAGHGLARALPWTALHHSTGTSFNHTIAVGDLNADGKLDVAIPNSQLSAVTVLLGNGDGTLAPFQSYPTFSEPQDVVMADLTGDGIPDLATADYTGGGITLLRGLGDGTFATRVAYPAGAGLISLTAVDLDGDDRLDLAISKEAGHKVAVLPALAGGGFGSAVETSTGSIPHQIAMRDFDHDGWPDIAVASHGAAAVSIHAGNGSFTLDAAAPFAAGAFPVGLTVADLDLDGDDDLLLSNVNAATVSVLLGNGDGTFAAPVPYSTAPRPRGMDSGDLDDDGLPDVAVATGYPDGDSLLTLLGGTGGGALEPREAIELPYRAADCVVADMNGDGFPDLVVTGPQAGVVSVLINPGGTVGVPPPLAAAGALSLEVRPNPASGPVTIGFRVPSGVDAALDVFDLGGRRVAHLGRFSGDTTPRLVEWHGGRAAGERLAPGLYLVRLSAAGSVRIRRVALLAR